ncbi:MspA protein [Mycolicibacterium chubuense NBB4]|uniref:MspA protein n=1 Tax=Mycolicibacterium chubuense (strain NBB4) TaxID=710421 RepID=I4BE71_MYCCN|nr:MspA family porin [Mycolicibacterium chubuense]AFM15578.1 MspA protein [Mycolicibacterium chubuense NBB4]
MKKKLAALAAVSIAVPVLCAPVVNAQPAPPPPPAPDGAPVPPPDNGIVASSPPGVVTTPDGWILTVAATGESQLPVAPLTTAVSSREYLAGGTFVGTVTGNGKTKLNGGTLDTGYQIGCGIQLGAVKLIGSVGIGTSGSTLGGLVPTGLSFPISGTLEIHPQPGTVSQVSVDKKSFKSAPVRVTLKDIHIKVDGCVGQSFLRSYATLTSSTTDTDDIVAYYGVTKAV